MPVYDTDANGCDVIYMDKFLFPSHCDCKCLPPGYTLFRKPPPPTTPLPGPPEKEGTLPEGPGGGARGQVGEREREKEGEKEEVDVEEVEVEVDGDGKEKVEVKVLEVNGEKEAEKAEGDTAVSSIDHPEKLQFTSRPGVPDVTRTSQQNRPSRVTPSRAPPPAAIRRHVTVRPRPRRPPPGHRNHLRGPAAGLTRR